MSIANCPVCGSAIERKDLKGKAFPWKDFVCVDLDVSFKVKTCVNCNESILSGLEIDELDQKLEQSIRHQTSLFLDNIKNITKLSQKVIAKKIGITQSYLSDLFSRKKTPSYQIFNLLKILSNNPNTINDLDCFKGNCDQIISHVENEMLKRKFSYTADPDIQELSHGSPFRNIMSTQREGIIH